jgi:ABC-2 type transport system ATP-binding protein
MRPAGRCQADPTCGSVAQVIEVNALTKRYGDVLAVNGLTFTVRPGHVTGFLGPNGAGKSTTLRMILGLNEPTSGSATIDGRPFRRRSAGARHVGALLDANDVHGGRSAVAHLSALARSNGLPRSRVEEVLGEVGLAGVARRRVGGFSLGMRQRLGIAAAMLGDPPVLILDEPFNGMDPEGIIWIRHFLRSLAAEGRAVLVSSHLMGELQDTADQVVVVGRGRVLADTTVDELLARASGDQVLLRTPAPREALDALHRAGTQATVTDRNTVVVAGVPAQRVVEVLNQAGVAFSEVTAQRATLEDVYLQLTGGETEYRATAGSEQGR